MSPSSHGEPFPSPPPPIERPLDGCIVGISTSETEELAALGFDAGELNRCVVRLSEALLAAGARLAFGHDWRPGGVMEAVAALAVRYFKVRRDEEGRALQGGEPIINRVPWPATPFLRQEPGPAGSDTRRKTEPMARLLEGIIDVQQMTPPGDPGDPNDPKAKARALKWMREDLAQLCDVRVCFGGRLTQFSGNVPGIIEEAIHSLTAGRPVFASAIFGGASRCVACGLGACGEDLPPYREVAEFTKHGVTRSKLEGYSELVRHTPGAEEIRSRIDAAWSREEHEALWSATSVERCTDLILRGIVKVWPVTRAARRPLRE